MTDWRYRGIVTFVCEPWPVEYMHLFTCSEFSGQQIDCNEGVLEWVPRQKVTELPIWQGDKIFLKLLWCEEPFFSLKLVYSGDELRQAVLNGKAMDIAAFLKE